MAENDSFDPRRDTERDQNRRTQAIAGLILAVLPKTIPNGIANPAVTVRP
jgi:hypothetical protein